MFFVNRLCVFLIKMCVFPKFMQIREILTFRHHVLGNQDMMPDMNMNLIAPTQSYDVIV